MLTLIMDANNFEFKEIDDGILIWNIVGNQQ